MCFLQANVAAGENLKEQGLLVRKVQSRRDRQLHQTQPNAVQEVTAFTSQTATHKHHYLYTH